MSDRFLPKDPVSSKEQIVEELYDRLSIIRSRLKVTPYGEFDKGIDCAMQNELYWLEELLDTIERS